MRRGQRLGQPIAALALDLIPAAADFGQHQIHQPLEQLWITPERIEDLVEDHLLFVPVEHDCRQCRPDIFTAIKPDRFDGGNSREHAVRADLQPRGTQHP